MVNPVIVSVWLYSSFNLSLWLRPFDFPNSKIFVDLLIVNHLSMCLKYVSPMYCVLIPSSHSKPILTVPRARRNWVGSAYPTLHKFADSYYYHLPSNLRSCPPKTVPFSFLAGVPAVPWGFTITGVDCMCNNVYRMLSLMIFSIIFASVIDLKIFCLCQRSIFIYLTACIHYIYFDAWI